METTIANVNGTHVNIMHIDSIEAKDIASINGMRPFVKRSDNAVGVHWKDIVIREGFNLRSDYGDLLELANSIEAIGLQQPIKVEVLNSGTVVLVDGERRYRAITMLRERSEELAERFEVVDAYIYNKKSTTEKDRIISMMTSNTGKAFNPMEEAEGFRRLRDEHDMKELKDIAVAVGRSVPYVEQRLRLLEATDVEKEALAAEVITPTAFVQLTRMERDPEQRAELLTELIEEAPEDKNGKKKVKVEAIAKKKDNMKNGKKQDLADMEHTHGNKTTATVHKATIEEVLPLLDELAAEIKEIEGLSKNQILLASVNESNKIIRKIKKLLKDNK